MKPLQRIIHEATGLASVLPRSVINQLVEAIASKPMASLGTEISQRIPHHQYRENALGFIAFLAKSGTRC